MAAQGDGPGGHAATVARAGSPLTCFGVNRSATRLYFIGVDSGVYELAMTAGGWNTRNLLTAAPNSPLTCYGFNGHDPRVYFIDPDSHIIELALKAGQWTSQSLPGRAAHDSPLTCLGLGGKDCRLYYVGTDRRVIELASDQNGNFRNRVLDVKVAPGSGLTCEQDPQKLVRVFYVDGTDHLLHVLAYDNVDDPGGTIDEPIDGTDPAPGSALTCFGMDTGDTRLYYLDRQGRINEMAWSANVRTNHVLHATAMPGSALTCFGVGGQLTRLYYLDSQARVNELGWSNGNWANHVLPGTAARDSALTCFGFNGMVTRLYYLDAHHRVNELAWQTHQFVNSAL